jgi:hypothetical protein
VGHLGLTLNPLLAVLGNCGRLIDIGGASLHLYSIGEGTPPVVFEAGIAAGG